MKRPTRRARHWFDVHAYPSGGGVSIFFRDITERKRIEDERLTTSKLESLGTLAGGIAHDLNNILTVISGNIGLAQIEAPRDCGNLLSFLVESRPGRATRGASFQPAAHFFQRRRAGEKSRRRSRICSHTRRNFRFTVRTCAPTSRSRRSLESGSRCGANRAGDQRARDQCARSDAARRHGASCRAQCGTRAKRPPRCCRPGRYLKVAIADRGSRRSGRFGDENFRSLFHDQTGLRAGSVSRSATRLSKSMAVCFISKATSHDGATFTFYLPAADERGARRSEPTKTDAHALQSAAHSGDG